MRTCMTLLCGKVGASVHGIFDICFGCLHVFSLNSNISSGLKQLRWENTYFAYISYYHLLGIHIGNSEIKSRKFQVSQSCFQPCHHQLLITSPGNS